MPTMPLETFKIKPVILIIAHYALGGAKRCCWFEIDGAWHAGCSAKVFSIVK